MHNYYRNVKYSCDKRLNKTVIKPRKKTIKSIKKGGSQKNKIKHNNNQ